MSYFDKFPSSLYTFANGEQGVMQNISAYAEILDEVKTNSAFYKDYYIRNGDRPDNVAFSLYENPTLHWTLFMMNDHLREQGWPLDHVEIVEKAKKDFPYITLTTEDSIIEDFSVGSTVTGNTSAATGTIVSRNLDLGQLVVETTNQYSFQSEELLNAQDSFEQLQLVAAEEQYLAAHHYFYSQEFYVVRNGIEISGPFFTLSDAEEKKLTYPDSSTLSIKKTTSDDIFTNVNDVNKSIAVEVTNLEFYIQENDKLRQIVVLKPSSVNKIVQMFRKSISS